MSTSTITVGGNSVTLVALPSSPAFRVAEFTLTDAVSIVSSPFTGQTQAQQWPGGDSWGSVLTLPPLQQADADEWIAFLMQMRGMANAFQVGDPLKAAPRGTPSGTPLVDNTQNGGNQAMSQSLGTKGWTASTANLLLRGDYIQIGYRLHRVLDPVSSDASGNALISIFPSLREQPTDSGTVVTSNARGLWRLATNQRKWSADYTKLSSISIPMREYR
ncbi:MAG TPA: hypothetical protein VGT04_07040 [Acidobacteriaceae bacterium]|nr:hypothetical protein [Acidobacteriaceae bacterium]